MNRKLILLNLVLLTLAGWLFWMLRLKWVELHQHEHTVLALSAQVRARFQPPAPTGSFRPMSAADYNEIAQKMLFARDRNPNVIVEPPPPPKPLPPPPPMPELPAYYGAMLIGDPVVLLKLPKGQQKRYHAGEKVGPFQLVSFDRDKVVFEWDGKTVERKLDELKEKEHVPEVAPVAAAVQAAAPATGGSVKMIGGASDAPKVSEILGKDNGGGVRQCVAGDETPPGKIVDGYKKRVSTNLFGQQICMWELVNP